MMLNAYKQPRTPATRAATAKHTDSKITDRAASFFTVTDPIFDLFPPKDKRAGQRNIEKFDPQTIRSIITYGYRIGLIKHRVNVCAIALGGESQQFLFNVDRLVSLSLKRTGSRVCRNKSSDATSNERHENAEYGKRTSARALAETRVRKYVLSNDYTPASICLSLNKKIFKGRIVSPFSTEGSYNLSRVVVGSVENRGSPVGIAARCPSKKE